SATESEAARIRFIPPSQNAAVPTAVAAAPPTDLRKFRRVNMFISLGAGSAKQIARGVPAQFSRAGFPNFITKSFNEDYRDLAGLAHHQLSRRGELIR